MIYDYFSEVRRKLESIKWVVIEQSVNFVSDEIGVATGKLIFNFK